MPILPDTRNHNTSPTAEPYAGTSSRTLVAVLVLMWERGESRPDVVSRTIEPVRAELRRREVAGYDDPFHPIHDRVTR